ncbi:tRNA preQ1(34) S-adenosylmethionine ribosyltransferase-isomerase QueA [bacterium]|nr:tRNA preQ1(34) S-adenosylmethionine ribosyltransferase-isomerase QueA [bacterium]
MLKKEDFYFNLPKELIAQKPIEPRDHSRLLVLNKGNGEIKHKNFFDIIDYFKKGDVLIINNTKVFPARLIGEKKDSHGKVEVFLLLEKEKGIWECLVKGKNILENQKILFPKKLEAKILFDIDGKSKLVKFNFSGKRFMDVISEIGIVPLPPYIKREIKNTGLKKYKVEREKDKNNYQTVYAKEEKKGSVAAPTAGFHFTEDLIKKIKEKGVEILEVTLQVGLGTFSPLTEKQLEDKKLHREYIEIKKEVVEKILLAKKEKRRVITVGTTSTRAVESVFSQKLKASNYSDWTDIFIYPGYKFKVVDCLITNFHLPESSLIMLVSAFAGRENVLKAYKAAVNLSYRFYSYGDAMLII